MTNNGCQYQKLIADGVIVCAWRGSPPSYVKALRGLCGIVIALATKEGFEKFKGGRSSKAQPGVNLVLPGF